MFLSLRILFCKNSQFSANSQIFLCFSKNCIIIRIRNSWFFNKHYRGKALRLIRDSIKSNRERNVDFQSFAYTQTIARLYANDCVALPKRLGAYTRFESQKNKEYRKRGETFCGFAPLFKMNITSMPCSACSKPRCSAVAA